MGVAEEALDNAINGAAKGGLRSAVEGAADAPRAAIQDVGVDHRRGHVCVAEQLLDGADVVAVFEQMGGKGMAESMGGCVLGDGGGACGGGKSTLDGCFVEVVAPQLARVSVEIAARGGKQPLPCPLTWRRGVLSSEGVGERDGTVPGGQIGVVLAADDRQVLVHRHDESFRHERSRSRRLLPSRTRISRRARSTSLIRSCKASSERSPPP